ncbi:MAG: decaprenyl-phosphate phosphoribosyltransferase [Armatimonadetes bacterium]|nr:decaprenyl-phosphate phosphoribosyltransferase [Armatimonadota bacterium]
MIGAIIKSMRPRQWTKNFFVFAALLFTLDQKHPPSDFARVGLAFALFCILSGGVYVLNDIMDAERDRKHPLKSKRPIASGKLSIGASWTAAFVLLAGGTAASFMLDRGFGIAAAAYLVLQVAYSFYLKHVVILDVMTIATGFVLRAVAGAEVINVDISPWLLMCTILLALFLGLAKRRAELVRLEENAGSHRVSLERYSVPFLDQLIGITTASTVISYALYTFFSETGKAHPYMMATLPFVIYGVFRYLLLIQENAGVESPEMLVVGDKPLLLDILLWAIACALIVKLG